MIWIICLALFFLVVLGLGVYYFLLHMSVEPSVIEDHTAPQHTVVIPSNVILAKAGDQYDLYLIVNDGATTTGQFFLLDKSHQQKIMLGNPFEADKDELTGFVAASVSKLILSHDEHYIAFDQGTSVEREWSVFNITSGKEVGDFCGVHDPLFWDDVIIYLACDRSGLNTTFEAGVPNIEAVNLSTNATTTLVTSDISGDHFFYALGQISSNELTYSSTKLQEDVSGAWDFATTTATSVTLDLIQKLHSWTQ